MGRSCDAGAIAYWIESSRDNPPSVIGQTSEPLKNLQLRRRRRVYNRVKANITSKIALQIRHQSISRFLTFYSFAQNKPEFITFQTSFAHLHLQLIDWLIDWLINLLYSFIRTSLCTSGSMTGDWAFLGFVLENSPNGEADYKLLSPCSLFLSVLYWDISVVSDDLARAKVGLGLGVKLLN